MKSTLEVYKPTLWKKKKRLTRLQAKLALKENEDLKKAISESLLEQEKAGKLNKLRMLLEKVKKNVISDPNQIYYTCKITMLDGTIILCKILSTGTFEQVYDFVDTRNIDSDQNPAVFVPEKYIILSDYPRTVYERNQMIKDANLTLTKKLEFKVRIERVYDNEIIHNIEHKQGLSLK